ncbi:hypothetical protein ABPG75_002758 [Micractinium tetrahymenae]
MRTYDHMGLEHGADMLRRLGSMLDGSSLWLEAGNKFVKAALRLHTSNGGGKEGADKHPYKALRRLRATMSGTLRGQLVWPGGVRGPYNKASSS